MNVQEQECDRMGTLFNKYEMPKERENPLSPIFVRLRKTSTIEVESAYQNEIAVNDSRSFKQ
jgi:hypothetical protein